MHILIRKAISTWTKRHWGGQTLCRFRAIRDGCPLFSVCVKLHLYSTGRKEKNGKEEKNPTALFLGNVSLCPLVPGPLLVPDHDNGLVFPQSPNRTCYPRRLTRYLHDFLFLLMFWF